MRKSLLALALASALVALPHAAQAATGTEIDQSAKALSIAVLADTPYGNAQRAVFPAMIDSVNNDPKVRVVIHLGDLKNGSTSCSNEYLGFVVEQLARLQDPLVYTPGDNEWTDCHRLNNGPFDPLERLDWIRTTLFPQPGTTLGGRPKSVFTQAHEPGFETFVENVLWFESRVAFSAVHVVGSNNSKAAWTNEQPSDTERRKAERLARTEAAIAWIDRTFDLAGEQGAAGVVIAMQADMWDAFSVNNHLPLDGFTSIAQRLADRARAFGRPVLLLQGDSHGYLVDNPLAGADPVHHIAHPVPNLTRIVAPGATATQWLRLNVDPAKPEVFTWEAVNVQ
ncbi:MAG: metallophosphoesterase [Zoogloeaceae bacterium]|nr:metallophosphoesterase [Zoogloeaceae bacterium]